MDITYVWGENGPPESWKLRNAQVTGIQNTLTALGFEVYASVPGTGMSKEYWRSIEHNRYVGVIYIGYIDVDILIEEIFP